MALHTENARLETFSDGVFAIALTLLVLEIKVPNHEEVLQAGGLWYALAGHWPLYCAFILSFGTVLISWNGHNTLFNLVDKSSVALNYANGLVLLSVVILPFITALMGDYLLTGQNFAAVAMLCFTLLFQNVAWAILAAVVLHQNLISNTNKREAMKKLFVKANPYVFVMYLTCSILSFWFPLIIAVVVTLVWVLVIVIGVTAHNEFKNID